MAQVIPLKPTDEDDLRLTTQGAYPPSDDLSAVKKFQDWWQKADKAQSQNLQNEKNEHAFALGHQWDEKTYEEIKGSGRVPLVINKTLSTINVVSGYERSNRMRVRYLPVEEGDNLKGEIWTEVARVVQEQGDIDFVKSDAFHDMLKGGRGCYELRMDYTKDAAGEIVTDLIKPWELRIDPLSVREDLMDARYVQRAKEVSLEEILLLWPDKGEELVGANAAALDLAQDNTIADRDSDYNSILSSSYKKDSDRWQLLETWYYQVEKIGEFIAYNPMAKDWEPVKDRLSMLALLSSSPQLQWQRRTRHERKYYHAFSVGPVLCENNPSPYNWKGYPHVIIWGLKDEETGRHIGMVHSMVDPQMEVNKRRTQVLHILNRAAKSGWMAPKGAYGADKSEWEDDASKTGVMLEWTPNPSLPDGGKPQEIQPQTLPTAFVQMEQMASVDLRDVSGVNIELMGLSQKDTPGIVTSQRQKQAITILQNYFDSHRQATKHMGRILLSMMQQFYTDGRVVQIVGIKDPQTEQSINQIKLDEQFKAGKYDLVAEEAPWSPNQKMETALKLQGIVEIALKSGIPIPPDVIDYLDLPESFTMKWKQTLQKAQDKKPDPLANLKENVSIDRLLPQLTANEQAQILTMLGIQPDMEMRKVKQMQDILPPAPPNPANQ